MAPLGHILNFYEDTDLPLGLLRESFCEILDARVGLVDEKIDGQNITFTVREGRVETFYKGAAWSRVKIGGRGIADYVVQYSDRPQVGAAYISAHQAIQSVVDSEPDLSARLFLNGRVVVNCEMVLIDNLNTVPYTEDAICFVGAHAMDPELGGVHDASLYDGFVAAGERFKGRFNLRRVPRIALAPVDELTRASVLDIIDSIAQAYGLGEDHTVGDLLTSLVRRDLIFRDSLGSWSLSPDSIQRISRRIAIDDRQAFTLADARKHGALWDAIGALERSPMRAQAVAPFERAFHCAAFETFARANFEIAPNSAEAGEGLRRWVESVRTAIRENRVSGDPSALEQARTTLSRIDTSLFGKPVEGIVFPWRGKTRKLTGAFTPINKLRGMFTYGKRPLKILGDGPEVP
jgi:hypothetical protein